MAHRSVPPRVPRPTRDASETAYSRAEATLDSMARLLDAPAAVAAPTVPELVFTLEGETRRVRIGRELTVGRHTASSVVVPSDAMSRRHFRIFRVGDTLSLADMGSVNGTLLNGEPAHGVVPIRAGDVIHAGPYEFIVEYDPSAPLAPVPAEEVPFSAPSMAPRMRTTIRVEAVRAVDAVVVEPATPGTAFLDTVPIDRFGMLVIMGNVYDVRARDEVHNELWGALRASSGMPVAPHAVLRALNRALCGRGVRASAICVRLDAVEGRLTYAGAAHEPPWAVRQDGKLMRLQGEPSVELGRVPLAGFPEFHADLGEADVALVLSEEFVPALQAGLPRSPVPTIGNSSGRMRASIVPEALNGSGPSSWTGAARVAAWLRSYVAKDPRLETAAGMCLGTVPG
jgi:pSer/pThr/pTyr-binding forkhead associated (FHA) protein